MEFLNFLRAGYALLWVETHEENRAIKTFVNESTSNELQIYNCFSFDVNAGLFSFENNQTIKTFDSPVEFLDSINNMPDKSVIFAKDFHKFIDDLEVYRTIKNLMPMLKSSDKHIVFVSPVTMIPIELQKDIVTIDFNLPTITDLMTLAEKIVSDNGIDLEVNQIDIDAARGLTMEEAENSFARSLITTKTYDRKLLESDKLQIVKKSGLMEIYKPEPIENIGGLQRLKDYILSRKIGFESNNNLPTPKGICLTGGPGSGKSLSAKAIASVLEMPLIKLDLGTLKGSLVGESEKNMKAATDMIDAISPCVVWMDEIEKFIKNSLYDGLEIAFDDIKPINIQNAKLLEKAREWASNNAIIANETDTEKTETRNLNI